MTEFVRQILSFETLYRTADPYLSIVINIMKSGDELAWHFDTNDGVVSLMLQTADDGGEFEYAPYIRNELDENYGGINELFEGRAQVADRPKIYPGTFVLFKGRRSCHRVTPIGRSRQPRLNILYSYDEQPNMVFSDASQLEKTQPTSGANVGLKAPT
ncbi:MAG TPA: 2OG-Fe(II) oxygenase [Gammaproteobacteria bacterium]|nr:2OG-Fe(II) oxygenase [Gammaproteobacteria bacterium]